MVRLPSGVFKSSTQSEREEEKKERHVLQREWPKQGLEERNRV